MLDRKLQLEYNTLMVAAQIRHTIVALNPNIIEIDCPYCGSRQPIHLWGPHSVSIVYHHRCSNPECQNVFQVEKTLGEPVYVNQNVQ